MKKLFFLILIYSIHTNIYSQWSEQVSGVNSALYSVCSTPFSNECWICGENGVVLKTTNTGSNWINVSAGIPNTNSLHSISATDANLAFVVGNTGSSAYLFRTSNGGVNWSQVLTGTGFYNSVWMVNSTTGFMAGDPVLNRWSLWKTSNGGVNWDSNGIYCSSTSAEAGWNNALYIVFPRIWIGTNNTLIRYSSNWGASWTALPTTGEASSSSICFNWMTGQTGLIGGSTMLQTTNFGSNWTNVPILGSGYVSGITFTNLPVDIFISPAWYIRTSSNIYSSMNGISWNIEYTATAGNYNAISQARPGRGIWAVRSNGGISFHTIIADINKIGTSVPNKYELFQNYPNPFNPATTIKFQVPNTGFVSLKVFDALGKEIQTLTDQNISAGFYETKFNAENLSSGIYFYKLVTEKFTDVKKMVVVK
jgi:photosystem II stability/assembly factor-like uncharacterized protein